MSLPFDPKTINQTHMAWGLPENPPYVPNIQIPIHLDNWLRTVTGKLMFELQEGAVNNCLRAFGFNLYSHNGWRNEAFDQLVASAMDYLQYLLEGERLDSHTALERATGGLVAYQMARLAREYPEVQNYLPPESKHNINKLLHEYANVAEKIQRFQMTYQQSAYPHAQQNPQYPPNQGGYSGHPPQPMPQQPQSMYNSGPPPHPQQGGYPYPPQQAQYNAPPPNQYPNPTGAPPGYPAPPPQYGAPQYPSYPPQQYGPPPVNYGAPRPHPGMGGHQINYASAQQNGYQYPPPQQGPAPIGATVGAGRRARMEAKQQAPAAAHTQHQPSYAQRPASAPAPQPPRGPARMNAQPIANTQWDKDPTQDMDDYAPKSQQPTHRRRHGAAHRQASVPEQGGQSTTTASGMQVMNPNRPMEHFITEEGDEIIMAHLSNLKAEFDIKRPYTEVYDYTTHVGFHRKDVKTGKVALAVYKAEDVEGYSAHEINPEMRNKVEAAQRKDPVIPKWDVVTGMKKVPEPTYNDEDEVVPHPDVEQLHLTTEFVGNALSDEHAQFLSDVKMLDSGVSPKDRNAYEYHFRKLTPFLPHQVGGEDAREMLGILSATDDLLSVVEQLAGLRGTIDERLWFYVHDRMTQAFNEQLKHGLGVDIFVDSIVDDIDGPLELLCEEYGTEGGNDLYRTLILKGGEIIQRAGLSLLSTNDTRDMLVKEFGEEYAQLDETSVVFTENVSITHVPWVASDLHLIIGEGGAVTPSKVPELHRALEAIMNRGDAKTTRPTRRQIVTADGVVFNLNYGLLAGRVIIMSVAE